MIILSSLPDLLKGFLIILVMNMHCITFSNSGLFFFFSVEIYLHNVLVEETIEVRANLNLCLKEHTPKTNAGLAIV